MVQRIWHRSMEREHVLRVWRCPDAHCDDQHLLALESVDNGGLVAVVNLGRDDPVRQLV